MSSLDSLNLYQKALYNDMLVAFYNHYEPDGHERFGQSFYNFYYGSVFKGSFPELVYCEDNEKARKMIEICLINYVKKKIND